MMFPKGSMYIENSRGPKTDPCGTPYFTGITSDGTSFRSTKWYRSDRYDLNHFNACPWIPIWFCRRSMRLLWSMVSNVALRSSKTSIEMQPWSQAKNKSFSILTSAVSVLWWGLKPDWNSSRMLFSCKNVHIWADTTFSNIFDIKRRFEISLKLVISFASRWFSWGDKFIKLFLSYTCKALKN